MTLVLDVGPAQCAGRGLPASGSLRSGLRSNSLHLRIRTAKAPSRTGGMELGINRWFRMCLYADRVLRPEFLATKEVGVPRHDLPADAVGIG